MNTINTAMTFSNFFDAKKRETATKKFSIQ